MISRDVKYSIDDLGLGVLPELSGNTPSFTNEYESGFSGGRTLDQIRQLGSGIRQISVDVGDSIQNAIEKLREIGGGVITLRNGTHEPGGNISLYSSISIQGENAQATIIDFGSASYGIQVLGSDAYSTGTVSISNGGTTVTGSGTSWSSNVVAGQSILLQGIWYPVAVVGSDTSITIALPYAGTTLSGASYVSATRVNDVKINDLTIKNSATNAITVQYANEFFARDLDIQTSAVGIDIDDSSQITLREVDCTANNVGITITNTGYMLWEACGIINTLVGNGVSLTTVNSAVINSIFVLNSAGDGVSMTSCSNVSIDGGSTENGGQGLELVSGNSNIATHDMIFENNASDGVKVTATSDNCFFNSCSFANNGGYGVNIAASSCDENIIIGNDFDTNTSGAINDSGTDTMILGNTPQSVQTGVYDFGGATSFEIPNSAAPTVDAAGEIAVDTSITDHTGLIKYHDGTEELTVVGMPTANLSTTDGDVVKYNAANNEFEMGSVTPTQILQSYTAGENITSKDAVYIGSSQDGSGIGFDQVSGGEGTAKSFSTSYTVASNSDRVLVLCLLYRDASPVPTYAGNGFTLLNTQAVGGGGWNVALYWQAAPTVGSNTLAVSSLSSFGGYYAWSLYSFYNVNQSEPTDKVESTDTTNFSNGLTPTYPGSRLIACSVKTAAHGTSYTNMDNRSLNDDTSSLYFLSGESGNEDANPPVSVTQSATGGGAGDVYSQQVALRPVNGFSEKIFRADASAAGTANAFIGFADAAITSGASGNVVIAGEVTGLTSIQPGGQYYLSDTTGAIATSAGSVSRKVGIGTSGTTLNITNIW